MVSKSVILYTIIIAHLIAVKEIISYYCNNGSDVFSCALDKQKTFNKVNLVVLFKKLLSRDIPLPGADPEEGGQGAMSPPPKLLDNYVI